MTTPHERLNAIKHTEDFLIKLLNPKETPRVPKQVREEASRCLRHYPTPYDMFLMVGAHHEDYLNIFYEREKNA